MKALRIISIALLGAGFLLGNLQARQPASEHTVDIYWKPGRYAAWPANHGIWSWGNEILVGFESGYFQRRGPDAHPISHDRPAEDLLARSLDGGETWTVERHPDLRPPTGTKEAGIPIEAGGKPDSNCPGGIDFSNPNFALTAVMSDKDGGTSRFYYSLDRGKAWKGPYRLPDFGQPGTAARTDYLINGKHSLTLFLSVSKSNGKEGRVMVVQTDDGAKTWHFVSFIGPEPRVGDYAIMPSTVRLSPTSVLAAIRHSHWIEIWRSDDNLKTWHYVNTPVPETGKGNPPSMIRLKDGRIALTYGVRVPPYQIRARLSKDDGQTWGPVRVLRTGAAGWDIGYPRTVERPDGKIVTVYYWDASPQKDGLIAATIWDPGR
ncbi:MAG TPA: sialidase family protein [Terriglobia bacterium]|nr:sialidase family protein [Terriglobia bacterium]